MDIRTAPFWRQDGHSDAVNYESLPIQFLNQMTLYDRIGADYSRTRLADPRIVGELAAALRLPPGSTILDVGAGTGKYSCALAELGFQVVGIEPSEVMRAQGKVHERVRTFCASAEAIPLPSESADGALIVLALHHFADRLKAVGEILRVIGNGPLVVFTFEPSRLAEFWLADYFPKLGQEVPSSFSLIKDVAVEIQQLTRRVVHTKPFPLPPDLVDRFGAAGWSDPESYLEMAVRNGISSFALMDTTEVEAGLARLSADISSGSWDAKYGALRTLPSLDVGYRFIIADGRH